MANKKGKHGLIQTEGSFKIRGEVTGTLKDDAFKVIEKEGKATRNVLSFGLKASGKNEIYVTIGGREKDTVYFFKKSTEKGSKSEQKKVSWEKRFAPIGKKVPTNIVSFDEDDNIKINEYIYKEEGFVPIDTKVGLFKDESGKNITKTFFDYDAAEVVSSIIKDEMPVMVIGKLDFYSSDAGESIKRYKTFNITNIYNSQNLDFESEDFKELAVFQQRFIYMGIKQSSSEDNCWIIEGKIVNYSTIEDVEFKMYNRKLAIAYKKNLKPYTAITVSGVIKNEREESAVEVEDDWGGEEVYETISNPRKFEMIIKSKPTDIDTNTYTKEILEDAFTAKDEYNNIDSLDDGEDVWGDDEVPFD